MATNYSLICWGGRLGKSVTAATTDLITLTNHGLRDGTGVAFTSGTLPTVAGTALALNTIYFAKSIATSTFELYYDDALTSKIDFTGTGSALIMKSAYLLGLASLSRWGTSGSERIYDGLNAWYTARAAACTEYDPEVCEIGMAWQDNGSNLVIQSAAPYMEITTIVNGVRSSGWHGGVIGSGYLFKGGSPVINILSKVRVDGFSLASISGGPVFVQVSWISSAVTNMIIGHTGAGIGVLFGAASITVANNIMYNLGTGVSVSASTYDSLFANNIITKCTTGMLLSGGGRVGYFYNNISVGNTTNYSGVFTSLQRASNNFGITGDSPWVVGAGTTGTMATTDFTDWSNNDFTPALSTSPQVEGGTAYYGVTTSDIRDAEVPNYMNGGAEVIDAGCYEFDHGYGPHPASHTLTLQNVVVGSRILLRDQADTTTHYSADAAASTVVVTITLYGDARDDWTIKVRKGTASPYYQPWRTQMTATAGASSIYVEQIPDE